MAKLLVKYAVSGFDTWKSAFDDRELLRAEYGAQGHAVYQFANDPHQVIVEIEWPSVAAAKEFLETAGTIGPGDAGVIGQPDVSLLREVESEQAPTLA